MKTDELIVQLARSARPLTPLRPPAVRAVQWSVVAVLVMMTAVLLIGPRANLASAMSRPAFLGSLVVLLLTLAAGAWAAFVLNVPGAERSPAQHILPILTVAAWPAIWLVALVGTAPPGRPVAAFHWPCAMEIAFCALVSGWLLLTMIARAAPLRAGWTAAVASLASIAAGAAATQLICPLDDPRHQLIGHGLTALVVMGAGLLAGRRALRTGRLL